MMVCDSGLLFWGHPVCKPYSLLIGRVVECGHLGS